MCYEFWRQERTSAEEERAKREALNLIQKAKAASKPKTETAQPARRKDKEMEPAPV